MPISYMPQAYWGGLTGLPQAMQPMLDSLVRQLSLEGRAERQIAQDPYTWYNPNTGELGAGAGRLRRLYADKLFVDPMNFNNFAIAGTGQPIQNGMLPRYGQEFLNYRGNQALDNHVAQNEAWQNYFMEAMMNANQTPRMESGGEVKNPTKSQLESFLELIGIEREGVPIVAHPGEFVLNKEATNAIGKEQLERLNNNARNIPRMETGGPVGHVPGIPPQARQQQPLDERITQFWMQGVQNPNDLARALNVPKREIDAALQRMGVAPNVPTHTMERGTNNAGRGTGSSTAPSGSRGRSPAEGRGDSSKNLGPSNGGLERTPAVGRGDPNPGQGFRGAGATRSLPPVNNMPTPWWPQQGPAPQPAPTPQNSQVRPSPITPTPFPGPQPAPAQPRLPAVEQPGMPPIHGRAHNQMPNIPWEQLSQMDPGQAMAVLQQYANTQSMGPVSGLHAALNSSGPQQMQFMNQLMSQYGQLTGAQVQQAQTQGQQVNNQFASATLDDRVRMANLETQKAAAMSPYFSDLARLTIEGMEADVAYKNALQENAHRERTVNFMQLKPQDVLQMGQRAQDIWNSQVSSAEESVRQAQALLNSLPERGSDDQREAAERTLAKVQLRYQFLSGNLPLETPYEDIDIATAGSQESGFLRREKPGLLSQEEVDQIRTDVGMQINQRDRLFNSVERYGLPMGGNSGGMNFWSMMNQMNTSSQPNNP